MSDLPRTEREVLISADSMLVSVLAHRRSHRSGRMTVAWAVAFEELSSTVGPGGRPVGSGDPGGGRGATVGSTVERAVVGDPESDRPPPPRLEDRQFARLSDLPSIIVDDVAAVVAQVCRDGSVPAGPVWASPVQQLVWARWAIRATHHADRCRPSARAVKRLHDHVAELERLVSVWSNAGRTPDLAPPTELVHDLTEQWCRSCLRIGHRAHRSHRYPTSGLCRWCGDWEAAHGWMPTRTLVEAHRDGVRITPEMVRAARPAKKKKRRKR